MVKFFTIEFFSVQAGCHFTSFSWTRSNYTLKWKSEINSCVPVTIATRDAVTGKNCSNAKMEQITKVIDSYMVAVKKERIIVSHSPRKIS